jgi:hydrogenase-4 component B
LLPTWSEITLSDLKIFTLLITGLFVAGGISGLFLGRLDRKLGARLALTCAMGGSILAAYEAVGFWFWWQPGDEGELIVRLVSALPTGFPPISLDLFVDRLATFFLLLTGLLSAGVALYSFVWLEDKKEQHRIAGVYNYFVLFTLLLVVVNNVYLFLVCLECMTLAFSYLALYRHNVLLVSHKREAAESGEIREEIAEAKLAFRAYLVFSHIGVVFVTAALILLALPAGDLSFDVLRKSSQGVGPVLASGVFLLGLIGLGIKGGFAPAHPWVSIVHPKSPTTTHALTLGLVIKVSSFYMLIRLFFEFLPPGPWWWGWLVLLLAGLTALVGVFYAITSRDLKTALSNHSVENIGIILAGVGLALLLSARNLNFPSSLAGLALIAGLYHLLNHTVFKGLLYLCTGAIENRVGTVKLEELGGLIHRFPWTSVTFLIGAIAIAGFPPLNGFISEWLTVQVIFASQGFFTDVQPWVVIGLFGTLLMLGTAFGLTALAFVKIVGEALLGMPRRPEFLIQEKRGDVPWKMRGVLLLLAVLCLLLGIFPGLVVNQLALIPQELMLLEASPAFGTSATSLVLNFAETEGPVYTARLFILPLLVLAALPLALGILVSMRRGRRTRGPLWTCGTAYRPEAMQITGGAFAFLTWEWAGEKGETSSGAGMLSEGDRIPWRLSLSETRHVREGFRRIINAAVNWLLRASGRFGDWFQGGDIRQYLGYLFVVFILALLASVVWQGK